jgi:hypothetical protein
VADRLGIDDGAEALIELPGGDVAVPHIPGKLARSLRATPAFACAISALPTPCPRASAWTAMSLTYTQARAL